MSIIVQLMLAIGLGLLVIFIVAKSATALFIGFAALLLACLIPLIRALMR